MWNVGDGVSTGLPEPADRYFAKWTLTAPRQFVRERLFDDELPADFDEPAIGPRDSGLGVESPENNLGDGP